MMFNNPSNLKITFIVFVGFLVYMTQAGTTRLRVKRQTPLIHVGLGSFTKIIGPMNPFESVNDEDDKNEDGGDEVRMDVSFCCEVPVSFLQISHLTHDRVFLFLSFSVPG